MKMRLPLTAREVLSVGHWFRREDHVYEIVAWDAQEPLRVVAHAVDSAADQTFLLTELFAPSPVTRFAATRAALGDRLPGADQPPAADAASLPAHLLRRADHIIAVVEAVQVEIERLLQGQQVAAKSTSLTEITRRACQAAYPCFPQRLLSLPPVVPGAARRPRLTGSCAASQHLWHNPT